jgi:hypothetical protein
MTPAQQVLGQLLNGGARRASGTRKRRSTKKKAAAAGSRRRKRTTTRGKRGKARLVKGSAAAKRYMAKIRRMRKRK